LEPDAAPVALAQGIVAGDRSGIGLLHWVTGAKGQELTSCTTGQGSDFIKHVRA
jgi:hypothetical protein